ncbi:MAG: imidazoleglycerol-phosphate dehydratase HisB [Rhodoblastus sp.]|jgi:imidazoleglycerol-phosphate dehydratase|uniref:imidazoleglycerol-phosphate dehydratase HisB n=1 Tax=Rhodoblastus sp. TaxID=1962975 RepID=UPI003F951C7A
MRSGKIERNTSETRVSVAVDLDGVGNAHISTGVGFFDHMLDQIARHAPLDLELTAKGDLHIDAHHTVEDVGIAFGQAVDRALGDRKGITRYGDAHVPLDEALTRVVVDVSGRPFLVYEVKFPAQKIGDFDTELIREFFQAVAVHARIGLHIENLRGVNSHHIAESAYKGFARAFGKAVAINPRAQNQVPSTKGTLTS